ncbi:MAG: hypothetical protein WAM58_07155 [Candidatus Acidiferrum sp.]
MAFLLWNYWRENSSGLVARIGNSLVIPRRWKELLTSETEFVYVVFGGDPAVFVGGRGGIEEGFLTSRTPFGRTGC